MNSLLKIFAVLLAILLLNLYPIAAAFEQQDDVSELIVLRATAAFVDAVRDKGGITPAMYNDFTASLAATGNTFDIQMEHESKKYVPVYEDPARPETFQGAYELQMDAFYNAQILPVLFPEHEARLDASSRRYRMHVGDRFTVTVRNTNRTAGTLFFDFLNHTSSPVEKMMIPYGGMVRNEMD